MPARRAINFRHLRRQIGTFVTQSSAAAGVIWANQRGPRPARPFVLLTLISGGRPRAIDWSSSFETVGSVDYRIDAATEGELYTIWAMGERYEYRAQAGDDENAIRDALIASLQGEPGEWAASVVSDHVLRLEPPAGREGTLWSVGMRGPISLEDGTIQPVRATRGPRTLRVQFDVFADGIDGSADGADANAIAEDLITSLRGDDARALFRSIPLGVVRVSGPRDFSDTILAEHEERVTFDVTFNAHAAIVSLDPPQLKSVVIDATVQSYPFNVTATAP